MNDPQLRQYLQKMVKSFEKSITDSKKKNKSPISLAYDRGTADAYKDILEQLGDN